jgi:hypothetical protein
MWVVYTFISYLILALLVPTACLFQRGNCSRSSG